MPSVAGLVQSNGLASICEDDEDGLQGACGASAPGEHSAVGPGRHGLRASIARRAMRGSTAQTQRASLPVRPLATNLPLVRRAASTLDRSSTPGCVGPPHHSVIPWTEAEPARPAQEAGLGSHLPPEHWRHVRHDPLALLRRRIRRRA